MSRVKAATRIASIHFLCGLMLVFFLGLLVFFIWFPFPYYEISGGKNLFLILALVDVVCGPLLTLILFNPAKERWKWRVDLSMILLLQFVALAYGLHNITQSRPIFLAYEGDRFRVVYEPDIDGLRWKSAAPEFASPSWTGPQLLGVKLLEPTDPGFIDSIALALEGVPPAFRPDRWVPYESKREYLLKSLKPMDAHNGVIESGYSLPELEKKTGLHLSELGYLPLVQADVTDWIVLVGRKDGLPKAYWHIDGW